MTKKLLQKTQQAYFIFATIMLLVVAPLFYWVTERLYLEDADESLFHQKQHFIQKKLPTLSQLDIPSWNKFNTDIQILSNRGNKDDSLFYISYYLELEDENEPYRELNSPIFIENIPYTFSARINLVESEDLMLNIAALFVLLLVLLFLGILFINKKLSMSIWKPFYKILEEIEAFEIDKNHFPKLKTSNIEEFNRLNNSINKLINKNVSIYKNQREFVENAAHELQTPIAIFRAKIDLLIQEESLTEEQAKILVAINSALSRLNRLNKNLLLLSKIENSPNHEKEHFSIKELLQKQLIFFEEQAALKNIQIETTVLSTASILGNISWMEIIINNLLMNAIRHNKNGGKIKLVLSEHQLLISNTGNNLALSKQQIFNRFSKVDTSKKGNGLGLAIIKKITDLNNWEISYHFENNLHSFLLQF